MMMLFLKNNNVYSDCISRDNAKRKNDEDDSVERGICEKIQLFGGNIWWMIRLHTKYTLAPILRITGSFFFRVLTYWIILSYLSSLYNGIGLISPFLLFAMVSGLSFLCGKWIVNLRYQEALVNSICGVVLPIYLDMFNVVSMKRQQKIQKSI